MDYEKRGLEHSSICQFLVELVAVYFVLSTVLSAATAIYMCFQPESAIVLTDTGTSYRFDMLIGYAQVSGERLPSGASMVSAKSFCISYLLLMAVTKNVPVLIVLYHIRSILHTIKKSHSPFVPATVRHMKRVGHVMNYIGLVSGLIFQLGMGLTAYHMPYVNNPVEIAWIFAGMIVLLISEIFEWGCELQEFSDETL